MQRINIFRPKTSPTRGCFHPGTSVLSRDNLQITNRDVTGRDMIKAMLKYIWPADDPATRNRVKLALGLLVGAKMLNVSVPFIFKYSVDYLNSCNTLSLSTPPETIITVATAMVLGCK